MLQVSHERVIIVDKYLSEKTGRLYLTLSDGTNKYKLSASDPRIVGEFNRIPDLAVFAFDATCSGRVYDGGGSTLDVVSVEIRQPEALPA